MQIELNSLGCLYTISTLPLNTAYSLFLVCDVILSCLAGSLRSCFKQQGIAFPDDVTVYYPMNLESSNSLRCFTSFNIFSLPVGTEGEEFDLFDYRR